MQYALAPEARTLLIDAMFRSIMDADEKTLADELYLSADMLRVMAKMGMHIASHSDHHLWLDKISLEEQKAEVDASLAMLAAIHDTPNFLWSMCYPFGGYNASLEDICAPRGCSFGLTTIAGKAHVNAGQALHAEPSGDERFAFLTMPSGVLGEGQRHEFFGASPLWPPEAT